MEAFAQKLEEGKIDKGIVEILKLINSSEDYYTTSSCSGRIQLISLPKLGDKVGSRVLGKWHEPVSLQQYNSAIEKWEGTNFVMLLVQSPVIHVVCSDIQSAALLRNIGDSSGFKYSTIRSIHTSTTHEKEQMNIIVEILSTERMDIPIGNKGELFPSESYIQFILELAEESLKRSRAKLSRLEENLRVQLSENDQITE